MSTTRVALVTGANKGLGFEVARGLARLGWAVLLGSRDPAKGEVAQAPANALMLKRLLASGS